MKTSKRVFVDRFPASTAPTLCLLRRRVHLSREVTDDVVRARGRIEKNVDYAGLGQNVDESYFDDKQHGLTQGWHKNGGCFCKITHVDGSTHGLSRGWHSNGARSWEAMYFHGSRHGLTRWWRADGTLDLESDFEHGRLLGGTSDVVWS